MNRHYLLVCRGPDCKAQGSADIRERLCHRIGSSGAKASNGHDVVILPYTCLGRCGRGPNAVLYPDGVWFEALTTEDVPEIADHALGGPIPSHLVATVDQRHTEEYFGLFEEIIPELEAEATPRSPKKRRFWPF